MSKSTQPVTAAKAWASVERAAKAHAREGTLLTPHEMAQAYLFRDDLPGFDQNESLLLLRGSLAGYGPAWFWHRGMTREAYLEICWDALALGPIVDEPPPTKTVSAGGGMQSRTRSWRKDAASGESVESAEIGAIRDVCSLSRHEDLATLLGMLDHPRWWVRMPALEAVKRLATPDDLESLRKTAKRDLANGNVSCLVENLADFVARDDMSDLYYIMKHGPRDVRSHAESAIAHIASREDLPLLREMMSDGSRAGILAVARLGEEQDFWSLRELLKNRNPFVRAWAAEALGSLARPEAVPWLWKMLKDREQIGLSTSEVRESAAQAIARLTAHTDRRTLLKVFNHTDLRIQVAAATGLAAVANRDDMSLLCQILRPKGNRDLPRRFQLLTLGRAAEGIARLAGSDDIPLLRDMLRDKFVFVTEPTAMALERICRPEHLPVLRDMMDSGSHWEQQAAAFALARLGEESDLDALCRAFIALEGSHWEGAEWSLMWALLALDRKLYCPFPELKQLPHPPVVYTLG